MTPEDGIEREPHLRDGGFRPDPSEEKAWRALRDRGPMPEAERAEQGVWDEPALSRELAGPTPDGALTYESWLVRRRAQTTVARTWGVTLLLAVAAGPWALLGAFWGSGQTVSTFVAAVIFAPLVEETMKTAAALWVVEKRPYLFTSRLQIALCVLAAGFVFAVVENLMYLNVYVPDPPAGLAAWRWTVCTALHMGCAFVGGLGLMRIWGRTTATYTPPRISLGYPYLACAMVIHGTYNAGAVLLEMSNFQF